MSDYGKRATWEFVDEEYIHRVLWSFSNKHLFSAPTQEKENKNLSPNRALP